MSVIFCCELMCSCHDLHACMCAESLFVTPGTVAHQAPLSMGFCRQEHWSGSPCPPPGDLPDPETEPTSPVAPALHLNSSPLRHREACTGILKGLAFLKSCSSSETWVGFCPNTLKYLCIGTTSVNFQFGGSWVMQLG